MLIPAHLFIPGPTNVPEAVRKAMDLRMEDMRAPDFPKFTLPIFEDLKKIFKMKDGAASLDGKMIGAASEKMAKNVLVVAEAIEKSAHK
jgi:alanine-glyoxylate transaminase / serine-glyoxylate transaminase / serine-pyruvate transaminase